MREVGRERDGETIVEYLQRRSSQWQRDISMLLERTTAAANTLASPRTRSDLRTDAQTIRDLVTAGRAAYGLDQGSHGPTVQIAVYNKGGYTKVQASEQPHSPSMDSQSSQAIDT